MPRRLDAVRGAEGGEDRLLRRRETTWRGVARVTGTPGEEGEGTRQCVRTGSTREDQRLKTIGLNIERSHLMGPVILTGGLGCDLHRAHSLFLFAEAWTLCLGPRHP